MTISEMKEKLSSVGIPFDENAKKPQIQAIYDSAEAEGAFSQEEAPEAEAAVEEVIEETEATPEVEQGQEESPEAEGEYTILGNVKHDGVLYSIGDRVKMTEAQAEVLRAVGMVK